MAAAWCASVGVGVSKLRAESDSSLMVIDESLSTLAADDDRATEPWREETRSRLTVDCGKRAC